MTYVALTAFALLFGYLTAMAIKYGIPDMVSDTFYQLPPRYNGIFTMVLVEVAALMMIAILDIGAGIQCLAFIGCSGLCFVGLAPNYCDKNAYPIHKGGAMVAAMGCVGWALSVCVWPTVAIAIAYALYLIGCEICKIYDSVWHASRSSFRTLYWGELACFADTFATYFVCQMINDNV